MATKPKTEGKTYSVTLKNMGKTYKATGKSPLDALSKLEVPAITGNSILTVKRGKVSKEKILGHLRGRRAFKTMGMTKELNLKSLSEMFQGL